MTNVIDLRSDTVTKPSPAMREAMYNAAVGDDVYGDDPTVNELERLAAAKVGKEAALLVTSGTQGNLCGVLAHCQRGDEVIVGDKCHIYNYEAGGVSVLGGVAMHTVPTTAKGELPLADLAMAVRNREDPHSAYTRLVCLENTHGGCGGVVVAPSYMADVKMWAHANDLQVHLDGARVFNAAVALGVDVREITQHVDSVQFCMSKGLSAPIGSILAGSADVIRKARRLRKMVGGGMRQAGVIAAAGIVALTEMVDRLAEDHVNAKVLAHGLASIPGISIDPNQVETDIVVFGLSDGRSAGDFVAAMKAQGVLVGAFGPSKIRAVTHYGIDGNHIEHTLEIVRAVMATPPTVDGQPAQGAYR
jgi:threonine aldolase